MSHSSGKPRSGARHRLTGGTDLWPTMCALAPVLAANIARLKGPVFGSVLWLLFGSWLGLTGHAAAQDGARGDVGIWPAAAALAAASLAEDLKFPEHAESPDGLTSPRMALLKPPGDGPFAALVIMHQCSGLKQAVLSWARKAVERQYAVLLVDSLGPRGVESVCYGPQAGVNLFRGVRDALQAAEHLRRQPFVDRDRVALVGFSWGAMVGLMTTSRHYVEALGAGRGFAAVASFYPRCSRIFPSNGRPPVDVINDDIARPLLVLMGAADTETPAADCLEKLEALQKAGAPVEWHLYPAATHCWDCAAFDGFRKIDVQGHQVEYRFSEEVTRDSGKRLFRFLDLTIGR
jgi:dienelactone hydrolase